MRRCFHSRQLVMSLSASHRRLSSAHAVPPLPARAQHKFCWDVAIALCTILMVFKTLHPQVRLSPCAFLLVYSLNIGCMTPIGPSLLQMLQANAGA